MYYLCIVVREYELILLNLFIDKVLDVALVEKMSETVRASDYVISTGFCSRPQSAETIGDLEGFSSD
jgi:hypothetical protein